MVPGLRGYGIRGPTQAGMLMFMTTNREGVLVSGDPARSLGSLEALVRSSDVPLAAVELPSGWLLAVNPSLASVVGSTVSALTGSSSLDWLSPDERHAARLGFQALADDWAELCQLHFRGPAKCIVLDCDNTLWNGICGEDGPQGIVLDEPRRALQESLVAQHDAGMLLAIASKNNVDDVLEL